MSLQTPGDQYTDQDVYDFYKVAAVLATDLTEALVWLEEPALAAQAQYLSMALLGIAQDQLRAQVDFLVQEEQS